MWTRCGWAQPSCLVSRPAISAKNFVDVNWATGYDTNGRPIEVPAARCDAPHDAVPGPHGAHNWHPMSFNPQTGLVYLPAQNVPLNLTPEKSFAQNAATPGKFGGTTGWNVGFVLNGERRRPGRSASSSRGTRQAERGVEGRLCIAMERRHADHRRQSGVPRHARLHGQADGGRCREDPGLHPGHRRRDTAEEQIADIAEHEGCRSPAALLLCGQHQHDRAPRPARANAGISEPCRASSSPFTPASAAR